jgi:hypothetical protein
MVIKRNILSFSGIGESTNPTALEATFLRSLDIIARAEPKGCNRSTLPLKNPALAIIFLVQFASK